MCSRTSHWVSSSALITTSTSESFSKKTAKKEGRKVLAKIFDESAFSSAPAIEDPRKINQLLCNAKSKEEIFHLCKHSLPFFDAINASTAMHRLSKYRATLASSPGLLPLVGKCKELMHKFKAQQIANTASSCAKLNIRDPDLLQQIADAAIANIASFNSQDIANTAWAFATLGMRNGALFDGLAAAAISNIASFKSQEIANTAWAFATFGIRNEALFERLAAAAISNIASFNPQNISNTAWAFATLGISNGSLFERLAAAAIANVASFKSQEIANTAWAFATLGIINGALFERLAAATIANIASFSSQGIANTAWAFAALGIKNEALLDLLAGSAIANIASFNSQEIANTAWAFATLRIRNEALLERMAAAAIANIASFNSQDIANTAWAFATLGIRNGTLFERLSAAAVVNIASFNPQEIANTAWAFSCQWAAHALPVFTFLMGQVKNFPPASFTDPDLLQLHHASLAMSLKHPAEAAAIQLPDLIKRQIGALLISMQRQGQRSSKTHLFLSSDLADLGYRHTNEYFIAGYFLDIAFVQEKIAIEVDGSYHFLSTGELCGQDRLREDLLHSLGWRTIRVKAEELEGGRRDETLKRLACQINQIISEKATSLPRGSLCGPSSAALVASPAKRGKAPFKLNPQAAPFIPPSELNIESSPKKGDHDERKSSLSKEVPCAKKSADCLSGGSVKGPILPRSMEAAGSFSLTTAKGGKKDNTR